jgi:hypothetical protein
MHGFFALVRKGLDYVHHFLVRLAFKLSVRVGEAVIGDGKHGVSLNGSDNVRMVERGVTPPTEVIVYHGYTLKSSVGFVG